jgi:hypothetical protein
MTLILLHYIYIYLKKKIEDYNCIFFTEMIGV